MKYIGIVIAGLGIISLAIGGVFIGLAQHENSYITGQLREQGVTLGLTKDQIAKGELVDNAGEAQTAASTLAEHLKSIAPTYSALTAKTGKFDPTNLTQLDYAQGLNLENSMNMVVMGYGVIEEITATGAALIVIGLAMGAVGIVVFKLAKKQELLTARLQK